MLDGIKGSQPSNKVRGNGGARDGLPLVIVVVLNWNGREDTLHCLDSLSRSDWDRFQVVIVDNGSTDGSIDAIQETFPEITLLQTGSNLGYAGGNNVGIGWALDHGADYVLVLNNDTVVAENMLRELVGAAGELPAGSVLGAKIYFLDSPDVIWFAGGLWSEKERSFQHIGFRETDGPKYAQVALVDYISGCALFASATTWQDVGLFDERFFLTYEETDWCYRAKAQKHRCYVVPRARVWHRVSASFGGAHSPLYAYFMSRNKLLWAKKHRGLWGRLAAQGDVVGKILEVFFPRIKQASQEAAWPRRLAWSLDTWRKCVGRNLGAASTKAILFGFRDYHTGRFGDCPERIRELNRGYRKGSQEV